MRGPKRSFTNGEITVYWNPDNCSNAMYCINYLPKVFNADKHPWVDPMNASTSEIIEVVDMCPTFALFYEWNKSIK
jgi:uncharacterized Fe-S cluster protein YjdI